MSAGLKVLPAIAAGVMTGAIRNLAGWSIGSPEGIAVFVMLMSLCWIAQACVLVRRRL